MTLLQLLKTLTQFTWILGRRAWSCPVLAASEFETARRVVRVHWLGGKVYLQLAPVDLPSARTK